MQTILKSHHGTRQFPIDHLQPTKEKLKGKEFDETVRGRIISGVPKFAEKRSAVNEKGITAPRREK